MGLNKTTTDAIFLSFKNNKIAQRVEEGGKTIQTVNPRTGETITRNYNLFDSISGELKKVSLFEGKFGKNVKVSLLDDEELYVIDLPLNSDYCLDFLKRLPNLNLGQFIEVKPVSVKAEKEGQVILNKEGKPVYNFYTSVKTVGADGEMEAVKSFYSKENPLPEWKKVTVNGSTKLDRTDQINALCESIKDFSSDEQ